KIETFKTTYHVPEDISIVTVNPHMHLLGKSFKAYAISPNNDTIRIINIPKWDFRWQYFYTFQRILKIPANSVIHVEGIYDNTENNPLNPFHPPQVVSERNGSMRTTDEMFQLIVTWMPYQNGDEMISLELPEK
ncbi:MAG TPA: cytochrome c, partial [Bacteroidia bacterium]|nr:cytochrome c [Bacteroidia bacterium]